jgi:hypothetical protein
LATFRLLPTPEDLREVFLAPDERRRLRTQCFEPADNTAFADDAPAELRFGKACQRLGPELI